MSHHDDLEFLAIARERKFLAIARKRFERAQLAEADNRKAALDDLRFRNGEQWSDAAKKDRGVGTPEERPMLTINKLPTLIHQITNDQRQNRPTINVTPVGDESDIKTAEMLRGMIRAIQRNSDAEIAVDTAFEGAATHGFGYWRINSEPESPGSFDKVLVQNRIRNPFTVFIDPASDDPTTADKKWCLISETLDKDEFKQQYPKAKPINLDFGSYTDEMSTWLDGESVRVAEYWLVNTEPVELVALQDGFVGFKSDLAPEVLAHIQANPDWVVKSAERERKTVTCYKITAHEILEQNDWPDEIIPIVRVIGDEVDVQGKVTLSGIVRYSKDPIRMYNYCVSAEAERSGATTKTPFIGVVGQFATQSRKWANANRKTYATLEYDQVDVNGKPAPPPQRQQPIGIDAGILALKEAAAQDLLGTTGIRSDATKNERIADESGVAMEHIRQLTDLGSYHFHDNLARALKVTGGIYVRTIPAFYDTKRIATILRENGTEEHVLIDPGQEKAATKVRHKGKQYRSFNPAIGKYAVAVTIGPNYATKRREATAGMNEFLKVAPHAAPVIDDLIAKAQDWEGAQEMARRLAFTKPAGMLNPGEMDLSPEAEALVGQLQQQLQQMTQERQQMMAALTEKETEHALDKHKIDRDFEVRLAKIAADMEAKLLSNVGQFVADEVQRAHEILMSQQAQDHALEQQAMQPEPATT